MPQTNLLSAPPFPGTDRTVWIVRVGKRDAAVQTDALSILRKQLERHERYYPSIHRWVKEKVLPDLRTGRRIGYVGFHGELPVLAAVLKRDTWTKFCHLSIAEEFQDTRLGQLMFSMMAADARNHAHEIHFTLPENLWEHEKGFFTSFGFDSPTLASRQYRLFDQELRCSALFADVWSRVNALLPTLMTDQSVAGFRVNDGIVLSIREPHASAVMCGAKKVEVRRRFSKRWTGRSASVYCAGGSGSLLGTVVIKSVTKANPQDVWQQFNDELSCTRQEYDMYVGGRSYVYAIELSHPCPYDSALPLSQLSHLIGETLHAPQSYVAHSTTDSWGRALSVAAVIHGITNQSHIFPNAAPKHCVTPNEQTQSAYQLPLL